MKLTLTFVLVCLGLAPFSDQATIGFRTESTSDDPSDGNEEATVESVEYKPFYHTPKSAPEPEEVRSSPPAYEQPEPFFDDAPQQHEGAWAARSAQLRHPLDSPAAGWHPQRRQRRSADDYWYNIGAPSEFLSQHNMAYMVQNDARARFESYSRPLHSGRIYAGFLPQRNQYNVGDRAFGLDADFDLPSEINQFRRRPYGPRLTSHWADEGGRAIYSHNLYKLREPLTVFEVNKFGISNVTTLRGGVYKFNYFTVSGSLLFESVKTKRRYFSSNFVNRDVDRRKFQAIGPWVDPNGFYSPASADLGDGYTIKGSPITDRDPRMGNQFLTQGIPHPEGFVGVAGKMKTLRRPPIGTEQPPNLQMPDLGFLNFG